MEQEPWYGLAMRFTSEWDQRSFARSMTRCRWLTSSRWSAASSTGVSSPRPGRRRSQPYSLRAAERRAECAAERASRGGSEGLDR